MPPPLPAPARPPDSAPPVHRTGPGMREYTVPKRRVEVTVHLVGGIESRVTLFLAEASASREGGERLRDLLERGGEFLPAFDTAARAMTFIRRSAILVA